MKRILIIPLLMFLLQASGWAQTPEPIYSFAVVYKTTEYYKQQQKAWKAEIDKNPTNANAWYNYFKVSRILTKWDTADKRTEEEKWKGVLNIVDDMGRAVPDSFQYHLVKWISAGLGDLSQVSSLLKAAEMEPENPALCSDMINWGEISRDISLRDKYARLWYWSRTISPGFLNYNYNVLAGLKENAILVTAGDNDTYPVWILQAVQGYRKDVTVINTSLILIKEYREKLFKELGVPPLTYDPFAKEENQEKFETELVSLLAANTKNRPVYVALTAGRTITDKHTANLYLTGLAYEYSMKDVDNTALLKMNFENRYALDYLDKSFYADMSAELVLYLNTNYIVPVVKLYEHYTLAGDTQKAERMKSLALKIAKGTAQEQEVIQYFKG